LSQSKFRGSKRHFLQHALYLTRALSVSRLLRRLLFVLTRQVPPQIASTHPPHLVSLLMPFPVESTLCARFASIACYPLSFFLRMFWSLLREYLLSLFSIEPRPLPFPILSPLLSAWSRALFLGAPPRPGPLLGTRQISSSNRAFRGSVFR